ncbi:hypothetical protein [Kitasatospora sp. NPDC096204]|uniref:hypothetical protein n=1 Tax=Kitasatospora sp. NPDC096204 TaxID=3364094 RepID=UPI0037F44B78
MAETTAVSGGPDPAADSGPWDAVPPPPRLPAEDHPPGPAALYEPPPAPPAAPAPVPAPVPAPAPVTASVSGAAQPVGQAPAPPPARPAAPPVPPTGWTLTGLPAAGVLSSATPPPFPVQSAAPVAAAVGAGGVAAAGGTGGLGAAPRGRILVIEGGYGTSGRRTWGRGGPTQAPVLSAMLAAVSPQVLLAADAVDAVHLPGAGDPHTVLAHLRAASRHPGPLLIHLGGHVVADKRGGQLQLTLRDAKQDGLPWAAIAAELSHRPAEWQTLVIADLSADQNAWPYLQGTVSPLSEGIPLWAVVSPDPEQIGTFTRALIEALHGGRPGAGEVLAPEQLRQQVYSVLRPDVVILATHAPDRPFFRNTARRGDGLPAEVPPVPASLASSVPVSSVSSVQAAGAVPSDMSSPPAPPLPRPGEPRDAVPEWPVPAPATVPAPPAGAPVAAGGPVSLVKPGVPPTPPRPTRPVSLLKAGGTVAAPGVTLLKPVPADAVPEDSTPTAGVTLLKSRPEPADEAVAEPEFPQEEAVVASEAAEEPEAEAEAEAETAYEFEPEPEPEPEVEVEPEPEPEPEVEVEVEAASEAAEEPGTAEEPGEAVPVEPAPTDEAPVEEEPVDVVPAEEAAADELPADAAPQDEVPTDEVPVDATTDAPSADEAPAPAPDDTPVEATAEATAEAPADEDGAAGPPRADYREVIGRIVRSADAGDHAAATDLAFALELEAIAEHGAVSEPVLQVRQVRAHVCRLAGRTAEAADIYREVALTLLRSQGPDHPETQRAATNAEACWRAITDRAEAIRIAPEIIELRAYLPGADGRKLRAAERYLAQLAATG